ncbi:phosphomevalonate kinase [Batrachochytrium dendrobatidis]|nr:phosphomevalonate kinase [Batrachochytrium dendrobatidis]
MVGQIKPNGPSLPSDLNMSEMRVADSTTVTAPGKVLLTGGYLVLDRRFQGLVVAMDARFHTTIKSIHQQQDSSDVTSIIQVVSPQFTDGFWEYMIQFHDPTCHDDQHQMGVPRITATSSTPFNPFLETALSFSFYVLHHKLANLAQLVGKGIQMTVLADNDFYSQSADLNRLGLELTATGLGQLPEFNSTHGTIAQVRKTGLGSSAAMTTSVIASLLAHYGVVNLSTDMTVRCENDTASLEILYNLAQTAHCVAQGKIGSGFDVSAAVVGTHRYRRFSPQILDPVFRAVEALASSHSNHETDASALQTELAHQVYHVVTKKWDWVNTPFQLPPGMQLMLGDVAAGSNTPKLVSTVLAWQKRCPLEAESLWIKIDELNKSIQTILEDLCSVSSTANAGKYQKAIDLCATTTAASWHTLLESESLDHYPTVQKLERISALYQEIRGCLCNMSSLSGAPIEPPEQTKLLDACMEIPGVLMCGVPGAGGYDAIFCIVLSNTSKQRVHALWKSWTEMVVVPLLNRESQDGLRCLQTW